MRVRRGKRLTLINMPCVLVVRFLSIWWMTLPWPWKSELSLAMRGTLVSLALFVKIKKHLFAHIKDMIWARLNGWQGKLFSVAGKEFLIKAVIQSIPLYSMSLFKFPKSLVKDLHRICASFWWGSGSGSRKLHWASWVKLCRSKADGGLGFHDFSAFNQALLGKQCWRFIQDPGSLAAYVLKGCYFLASPLLQAKASPSGSFVWKSILLGRETILKGSHWWISCGFSVSVYHDRWLPRPSTFKVISSPLLGTSCSVDRLK
ncbi:hypothetical protein ACOSQ3_032388 [Xanthoceras sorbifolium]